MIYFKNEIYFVYLLFFPNYIKFNLLNINITINKTLDRYILFIFNFVISH